MAAALLAGCGSGLDDIAFACVDFDGPEFVTSDLPPGRVGEPYNATIVAEVGNEPNDDRYRYGFSIEGPLPANLELLSTGWPRQVRIAGTPRTAGTFGFKLTVSVDEPQAKEDGYGLLCWHSAQKSYSIVIAPGAN